MERYASSPASHLKVVRKPPDPPAGAESRPEAGDLALIGLLFFLNLLPVAGELSGIGSWSRGIVGFAVAAALLTGRELWVQVRARVRKG